MDMQVRITIRGREYTVRGDEEEGDIQALAADLDRRMVETAERTRSFDDYTVAMLTALNIASELRQLKLRVAQRLDELDRDAASIAAMVEAALPPEGAEDAGAC
jgi:cell division protein ZapA (FtsZ GTPase activity inhibitor)